MIIIHSFICTILDHFYGDGDGVDGYWRLPVWGLMKFWYYNFPSQALNKIRKVGESAFVRYVHRLQTKNYTGKRV
jgi:hypothetical protein